MPIYDYTQQPPRILIDEGDGHLVDKRIAENLRNGNAIFYRIDDNEFKKEDT